SQRGAAMPPSPIRKLVPYAEEAKRRGITVYHVNIGQPDIESPDAFLEAYREHDLKVVAYGHSAGLWEYRDQLVRYYARHDVTVSSDEIVVTTGGSEAIIFAFLAVCDPGDEVIIPEPFYTNYLGFAMEAGVTVVPVTCRIEDGFALPPVAELAAKITPRTRAIMICSPNNPTGYVYTDEELMALRDLVVERDLYLLADEVYREFAFDGGKARSVLTLSGIDDRAVMLDSISKRYSACGARVGCVVTRNREILDACLRMGQARLCPPTIEQMAAARAVDTPPEYLERVHAEYQARRDAVFEELAKIEGVVAPVPGGAFYAVARLPIEDADHFARWLLEEFDDSGETVMVAPAAGFYATPGLGRDEIRIAFVLHVESMRRAMQILNTGLAAYKASGLS
ncbi:MAG: pyridoxal phosphate-dependent aminotransferase, partial [Planctomycetota bacterium]